jgi:hypothetical protein
VRGLVFNLTFDEFDDIIVAIQSAQTIANRLNRPVVVMPDLTVHNSTEYFRQRAIEVCHPARLSYIRISDGLEQFGGEQ